jgi:hypothetical protein
MLGRAEITGDVELTLVTADQTLIDTKPCGILANA